MSETVFLEAAFLLEVVHAIHGLALHHDWEQDNERGVQADDETRNNWNKSILEHLEQHIQCPVGLAKLALGVLNKVNALLHSGRLECPTLSAFIEYLYAVVSITTDQGTEVGIGELPNINVKGIYYGTQTDPSLSNMEINIESVEATVEQSIGEADDEQHDDMQIDHDPVKVSFLHYCTAYL